MRCNESTKAKSDGYCRQAVLIASMHTQLKIILNKSNVERELSVQQTQLCTETCKEVPDCTRLHSAHHRHSDKVRPTRTRIRLMRIHLPRQRLLHLRDAISTRSEECRGEYRRNTGTRSRWPARRTRMLKILKQARRRLSKLTQCFPAQMSLMGGTACGEKPEAKRTTSSVSARPFRKRGLHLC